MTEWPGKPFLLGATWDGKGVNFALFSERATKVELSLFEEPEGNKEIVRIAASERTARFGMFICRKRVQGNSMATEFMALTSRRKVIVSTRPNSC